MIITDLTVAEAGDQWFQWVLMFWYTISTSQDTLQPIYVSQHK